MKIPCGLHEDRDVAQARHYRLHPDARGANIAIFEFYDDGQLANKNLRKTTGGIRPPPLGGSATLRRP